jgi:60 kDa SS-A/Ro ribonucleoprotein
MSTNDIPQSEPLRNDQVRNNAGGFAWTVDDMQRLRRFLCLGTEGGTYYQGEKELGIENAQAILKLIADGRGEEVVATIKTYSIEGRTSKQNPIMFALALCAKSDNLPTKRAAYASLSEICRIPTHLFMFIKYAHALGQNWGRAQRRAVSKWYTEQNPSKLAMAITKYQNREGYSHRDILRLSHPSTKDPLLCFLFDYITHGLAKAVENLNKPKETTTDNTATEQKENQTDNNQQIHLNDENEDGEENNKKLFTVQQLKEFLEIVEKIKTSTDENELVVAIKQHSLVREHMPTTMLGLTSVWSALLEKMPLTAMIRNLGKMSEINLLTVDSEAEKRIVDRLKNREQLQRARIHPFNVLVALETYKRGQGFKGKLTWEVNEKIKSALEEAFYLSFKFVKPTNQRYLLALDVSGSMSCGTINGSPSITPAVGSCAMCMVTLRTEPYAKVVAFSHQLIPVDISKEASLESVMETTRQISMGGTDCALPMVWAMDNKEKIDVFIVYTDSETWFGKLHPTEALKKYRVEMNQPNAKLIVVGMQSNAFTIADPNDRGMLDVVGFDSAAPQVMSLFAEGQI